MPPRSSTATRRSASPSNARPACAPCSRTAATSPLGSVDPHPSLMFVPSGSALRTTTSAPSRVERLGRGRERGAVPAVDDDPHARPARRAPTAAVSLRDVRVERARDRAGRRRCPSPRGGVMPSREDRGELRLDPRLGLVAQLAAAGLEELDAVVGVRVVAGRDHRPGAPRRRRSRPPGRGSAARRAARPSPPRRRSPRPAPPRASGPTGACRGRRRTGARCRARGPRRGRARRRARA